MDLLPPATGRETCEDVRVSSDLTDRQRREVNELMREFTAVLDDRPGVTHLAEHEIEVTTNKPVRVKQYPMPYSVREAVNQEVSHMLEMGVVEAAKTPYNAPVVLVKKADGTNRFCVNFQGLNAVTKFDTGLMPNPDDILAKLGKDVYFSKVDLSKGFWQIPMAEGSRQMTGFTTDQGTFTFLKMPFGLVNSGATFSRMMRKLLKGLDNVDNYLDDVTVHTQTWEQHLEALRGLLTRLRDAGLTARPTKCDIGHKSLGFVGHTVGMGQIGMEQSKLEQIRQAPRPNTKRQVRAFIGLAGYYRKFIPCFAEIAIPLTNLTRKGQPNKVRWEGEQEQAFNALKAALTQAPILRMPDFDKPFIVQCDASEKGIGAILLQEYPDGKFPVMCASKKLLPRECRYSTIERECLAIVYAIKKFYNFLYGREFYVETDHQPLAYIQRRKVENSRVMRWALFL